MAIVMINVIPLGTGNSSVSQYVARAVKILEKEKVSYEATPMGTALEGDLDDILPICRKMHEAVFSDEIGRVYTVMSIDDRRDKKGTMRGKMEALNKELAK